MNNKLEISRELATEILQILLLDEWEQAAPLAAILAAPVVERQPVQILQASYHWQDIWVDVDQDEYVKRAMDPHSYKVRMVYTAPPELAELQATIARLTAENERLTSEPVLSALAKMLTEARMKIVDRDLEIERLKGGRGEAVAWFTEDHLTDKSATTYDVGVSVMWAVKGWPVTPLYTSQPAPVSVVLPERKDAIYVIGSAYDDGLCEGWNACLDKVKELNQ